jgi:hypothetical protein
VSDQRARRARKGRLARHLPGSPKVHLCESGRPGALRHSLNHSQEIFHVQFFAGDNHGEHLQFVFENFGVSVPSRYRYLLQRKYAGFV